MQNTDIKPCIDFLITENCNYRCSYCSQSKKFTNGKFESADDKTIDAFIDFLKKTDKSFLITISGGEPFLHPRFFEVVEEIIKSNHKVFVVTNFSHTYETYKKLKNIAGDNLEGVFASLHLSQCNKNDFIKKAIEFNKIKGETEFITGSVLSDENCEDLKQVNEILSQNGVKFELQHMRIKNRFVKYNKAANDFISKFSITDIKKKNSSYGKLCYAGVYFMFIYPNGECYRCYSSRFNKVHHIGNIKDGNFKMYDKPIPCLNKNCTCPKPIQYNMIDYKKSNLLVAGALSLYNFLFVPYYIIKNRKIIISKLKQGNFFNKQTKKAP